MNFLGLFLTLSFALLVLSQSRATAAVSIIAAVCYITEGQVLDVGVFHFTAIRIVLLAGMIRVLARGESNRLRFNKIDSMLIAYACALGFICILRIGTFEEIVYQVGCFYNIFLGYFVFRCLLQGEEDIQKVLSQFALVIIPFVLCLLLESVSHRNVFFALGSVEQYDEIRYGHVRCVGPFRSAITTGAFGATFAMLFGSMLFARKRVPRALLGFVASLLILFFSHSSGAFLGLGGGFLAFFWWPLRRHTSAIRWGIVAVLVGLQIVMKEPVWFLLARLGDVFGGGGYHRAVLIDRFVNHTGSWWLMGTTDTHDWFPYSLIVNGQADITNMFVSAGVNAGLLGLILLVTLVVRCFRRLGLAMRSSSKMEPATERMMWGLGSTLVGSICILFSITYFDQMQVILYFVFACIAGVEIRKKQINTFSAKNRPRKLYSPHVVEGERCEVSVDGRQAHEGVGSLN
jgi:hypothetical protein